MFHVMALSIDIISQIYATRTASEARKTQQLPPPPDRDGKVTAGLFVSPPIQAVTVIPDVTPMRRGRLPAASQAAAHPKPSASPMRAATADPFAALDSDSATVRAAAVNELSSKYPALNDFSLMQDRGGGFDFQKSPGPKPANSDLSKRVTEALADEAFARPAPAPKSTVGPATATAKTPGIAVSTNTTASAPLDRRKVPEQTRPAAASNLLYEPSPQRPSMISTGTMTSPTPSPPVKTQKPADPRPIYRFPPAKPSIDRPASQNAATKIAYKAGDRLDIAPIHPRLELHRSRSHTSTLDGPLSPVSSRASLDGPPSAAAPAVVRAKSGHGKQRPLSMHLDLRLDFLNTRGLGHGRRSASEDEVKEPPRSHPVQDTRNNGSQDDSRISSDVQYLRTMEDEEATRKKHSRRGSGQKTPKRSSLPMSLSNTKNILRSGKFGDALRLFESNNSRAPQDLLQSQAYRGDHLLSPITSSGPTDAHSDDDIAIEDTEDLSPEVRRELERRRLSQEEKRVAEAGAEYRRRFKNGGGGTTKASSIQNRVKSLLDESKTTPDSRNEGNTDPKAKPIAADSQPREATIGKPLLHKPTSLSATTTATSTSATTPRRILGVDAPSPLLSAAGQSQAASTFSALSLTERPASRPSAPPKPVALRAGYSVESLALKSPTDPQREVDERRLQAGGAGKSATDGDRWEASFSKKYPSLSHVESVETEIKRF